MLDDVALKFLTPFGDRVAAGLPVAVALAWAFAWREWRRARPPLDHPSCARCGYDLRASLAGGVWPECGADLSRGTGVWPAGARRPLPGVVSHVCWLLFVLTGACAATAWAARAGLLPHQAEVRGTLDLTSVAAPERTLGVSFLTVEGFDPVPAPLDWDAGLGVAGTGGKPRAGASWHGRSVMPPEIGHLSGTSLPMHTSEPTPASQPLAVTARRLYDLAGLDPDDEVIRAEVAELARLLEGTRAAFAGDAEGRQQRLLDVGYRGSAGVIGPFRVVGSMGPIYSYPWWLAPLVVAAWAAVWGKGTAVIRRRSRPPRAYTEPMWDLD